MEGFRLRVVLGDGARAATDAHHAAATWREGCLSSSIPPWTAQATARPVRNKNTRLSRTCTEIVCGNHCFPGVCCCVNMHNGSPCGYGNLLVMSRGASSKAHG